MQKHPLNNKPAEPDKDGLLVIAGAGGFIAGALVRYFHERGFTRIRRSIRSRCRSGTSACLVSRVSVWI